MRRWSPKCLFFLPPSFKPSLSHRHLWLLSVSLWCRSSPHPRIAILLLLFSFWHVPPQMWRGRKRVWAAQLWWRRWLCQHAGLLLLQLLGGLRRAVLRWAVTRRRQQRCSGSAQTRFLLCLQKYELKCVLPFLFGSFFSFFFCTVSLLVMGPGTLSEAVRNFGCA